MSNATPEEPLVSVVVRCLNEEEHIGKLLYGIGRQDLDGTVETIVVDSGSTDDTLAIAAQFPVQIVHVEPTEFSFGRALNLGCHQARGHFLVFASAHVYPIFDDWLKQLLAPFESDRVALCYGRQEGGANTKYSEQRVFRQWFPEHSITAQETPFCNNANCAIRRELWERFPYDEHLTGLEDLDWARRVKEQGYQISYAADAVVAHIHDETPRQVMNRYRREAIALKRIYPDQTMSITEYLSLLTKNVASDYAHAAAEGRLRENLLEIPMFRAMQFTGAFRGLRQTGPVSEGLKKTFYYPAGPTSPPASRHREWQRIEYEKGRE